jgi:hypothetical protein
VAVWPWGKKIIDPAGIFIAHQPVPSAPVSAISPPQHIDLRQPIKENYHHQHPKQHKNIVVGFPAQPSNQGRTEISKSIIAKVATKALGHSAEHQRDESNKFIAARKRQHS